MAEKVGENVGYLKLPPVAMYVVRDYIEKWSPSLVEDTAKQRLNIQVVYVVGGIVTALAFVEE